MNNQKRILIGVLLLWVIVVCSVGGFFVGRMINNAKGRVEKTTYDEVSEILSTYQTSFPSEQQLKIGALKGMASSINDPYTYFFEYKDTESDNIGVGINVSIGDNQTIITSIAKNSPAANSNLRPGDILYKIGDQFVDDLDLNELNQAFEGKVNDEKIITVKRGTKEIVVNLFLAKIISEVVESKKIDNIGYIKINNFLTNSSKEFKTALTTLEEDNIEGLIIDVRDNPGGTIDQVVDVLNMFLTGDKSFLRIETPSDEENTNQFYRPVLKNEEKKEYDIKVLINESSASAAEVFAVAMKMHGNYDLIGKTTFGKGIFQQNFALETMPGYFLHVTLGNWYGPDDYSVTAKGIAPTYDIEMPDYIGLYPQYEQANYDTVSNEIKICQLMLKGLGNTVRTDGYFGDDLKEILESKYSSESLTMAVIESIYLEYYDEMKKIIHDTQLNKAIVELGE